MYLVYIMTDFWKKKKYEKHLLNNQFSMHMVLKSLDHEIGLIPPRFYCGGGAKPEK